MGWGAHVEGLHQEAELALRLLQGQADRLQHLALQIGIVDAQRAAAELQAVEHQVVGLGAGGGQGFGPALGVGPQVFGVGGAEGVVQGFEAVFAGVELEHREIHHPEEVPLVVVAVGGHQAQLAGQELAHPIEGLVHRGGVAGAKQQQGAGGGAGALQQLGLFGLAEVVLDGADRVDLAVLPHPDEGQAAGASLLGLAEHIAAGLDAHIADGVVAPRNGQHLHRTTGGHRP